MFISISLPMQFNCKLTVTSPIALQTTALKPPVFHYGRGAVVVTFQLQGSHVLKHNLLYLLFLSKWDQNLQNKHHHVLNTTEPQTLQETVYWANKTSDKQAHFLITLHTIALLFQFSGVADGPGFTFHTRSSNHIQYSRRCSYKNMHLHQKQVKLCHQTGRMHYFYHVFCCDTDSCKSIIMQHMLLTQKLE